MFCYLYEQKDVYYLEECNTKKYFYDKNDALIYMFDHGIKSFQILTKPLEEYKNTTAIRTYDFYKVLDRVGVVQNKQDSEPYRNSDGELKFRKAYKWNFVGFGEILFAPNIEELIEKVTRTINFYKEDQKNRGYNTMPFYTKYFRL